MSATDKQLRGFGLIFSYPGGPVRSWYAGADGIKRWTNSDEPIEYEITDEGRAIAAAYKARQEAV
jgi:hypothetical protein